MQLLAKIQIDFFLLFLSLGVVYWVFILWYEGKKDGFESHKILDMGFLSVILSASVLIGLSRLFEWIEIYRPQSILLTFDYTGSKYFLAYLVLYIPPYLLGKKLHWSINRLLDIYSLSSAGLMIFVSLGQFVKTSNSTYLWGVFGIISFLVLVYRLRTQIFVSGLIFGVSSIVLSVFLLAQYGLSHFTLDVMLFILGVVQIFIVGRRYMLKRFISSDLLNNIKSKLLSKKKDLIKEQEILLQEDPSKLADGEMSSPEYLESAVMGDAKKADIDATMEIASKSLEDVESALSAMKKGTYGMCESCKKPIDVARLKALPEATKCFECAQKEQEISE